MEKRKCPFCEQEFNGGSPHIYKCKNRPFNLSNEDIKYEFYKFNFPYISKKNNLYQRYLLEMASYTEIQNEYSIDLKAIKWLLEYLKIPKRTRSNSCVLGAQKAREYYRKKFKVDNCSQLEEIKAKKAKTFIKNYGVDNIRKWKPFYDYIDRVIEEKYGMTKSEYLSLKGKEHWAKLTDEQKNEWLNRSIHSDESSRKALKQSGYRTSILETRIEEVLKENNISYTHQFLIKKGSKSRKFYDFYLPEYDIIIEVNGDYWHANPENYKSNDIIHYCFGKKKAKEIWERDKIKKEFAENKDYKVIYIWEKELNRLKTNKQILEHLKTKLL